MRVNGYFILQIMDMSTLRSNMNINKVKKRKKEQERKKEREGEKGESLRGK